MAGTKPVVFGGPSASQLTDAQREKIDLRPPVRRGDVSILSASATGPGVLLIVDGLFGSSMAVTPAECRDLIEQGWTVYGAASMGALRAAELWSVGMIGLGTIYDQLRTGIIERDDELATAYDADTYTEIGASLVHVRAVLSACSAEGCDPRQLQHVWREAVSQYWMQRTWRSVCTASARLGIDETLCQRILARAADPLHHPKIQDATYAVHLIVQRAAQSPGASALPL